MRHILRTWWPLAASWLLMGFEGPAVAAVVARMADPKINLAAWGGIVFPLSLMVEAPIIMMLAASTALCRDWTSYVKLRRFMMWLGASMTAIHILMVATPLYYVIVRGRHRRPRGDHRPGPHRPAHHDPLDLGHRLPPLPPGSAHPLRPLAQGGPGHAGPLLGRRHRAGHRLLPRRPARASRSPAAG